MAKLFPKIKPFKKGYLPVGQEHKLYFELCGNTKGKPVLVLHGGPGAGCRGKDRQFFNPKRFNIILFDQRGAGRSKPAGSLVANKTQYLVEDIRKLLKHLGIKKIFLFGGSWGSTLALCYAIKYPKTVAGMLLRGIFLARKSDHYYTYHGPAKEIFPEAYEKLLALVPKNQRKNLEKCYFNKINSRDKKTSKKFAQAWLGYEQAIMYLKQPKEKRKKRRNMIAFARIESYYLSNFCFLKENHILNNANKIANIPTTIVHGRYDLVCPPAAALELHRKLKNSKLCFTLAGHYSMDAENPGKLVEEMQRMGTKLNW